MMIGIGQRDEIALGVDHHLLDEAGALFEKAAQQVRLARPRIALDEQAGGEQFLNVDGNGAAGTVGPDVDIVCHEIGRASCRERGCQYVLISVVAGQLKTKQKTRYQEVYKDKQYKHKDINI